MNKKNVRTYAGKRSPLRASTRGGNILKEPSPVEERTKGNKVEKMVKKKDQENIENKSKKEKRKPGRPRISDQKKDSGKVVVILHCNICTKQFKSVSGLRNHSKKCTNKTIEIINSVEKIISADNKKEKENISISVNEEVPYSNSTSVSQQPSTEEQSNENGVEKIQNKTDQENIEDKVKKEKRKPGRPRISEQKKDSEKEEINHHCGICTKTFKSVAGLRNHSKKCSNKTIEIINTVEKMLNEELKKENVDDISTSVNEVFNNTPPIDPLPNMIGTSPSKCKCCGEDIENAHRVGDFQCYNCNKLFLLKTSLERHQRVIHMGESHECPQCGAKCPDKGTLARHMYTHTGLKPYSCPVCKQEFSRKYHLVRHNMQTGCDGKEKPVFPCQVCGREFNRKDNLREHLRAHAGQTKRKKIYSCDTCDMEFCGTNLLQMHKRIHSGEKHYCCDFCPKRFHSSGAMKKHRRTHTGERPFECSTCGKRFAAKETLNRHVRIHTGHKPHVCTYCGKRFIQSSQLRSHLFYHTGQSVFQPAEVFICELCGKTFNRRARLNEHTKFIHLGAKPFECEQCKKTFIRKEDLNRHLIIHSGIKAHKCPICSKSFAMKSSLKVHLLTHTKEPPRSCDECGRAFIRQDCLLRHMRNKHRDMLEEIRSEAEKKKLQQQLLQVAAEASLVEGMEDRGELDERGLTEAVSELLTLLVDETTLVGLGWPAEGVESVLESVIKRCGHEPAPHGTPSHERLRHNVKLLFTVVIDDSAIKALLNNQTIDQVILHVLRLAKS